MLCAQWCNMADKAFKWDFNTLTPAVKRLPLRIDRAVATIVEREADVAEAYARNNAPWRDRTTNARNGLTARAGHVPLKEHTITVAHGVPYGIWLEVRHGGKYRIIVPTINEAGARCMKMISAYMSRIDKNGWSKAKS